MTDWQAAEPLLRLGLFAGVLVLMMLAEACFPRRPRHLPRGGRWASNLGLVAVNTLAVRWLSPLSAMGAALYWVEERGVGLLPLLAWPDWLRLVAALLVLDLAIYAQHVVFHRVPWLWRLHRVHHVDLEFDVTTGVRFHTVEILLSLLWKLVVVIALGAPALAVLIFEVTLNAVSLFNHANLRLPRAVDRVLRWVVVTPDMHRVHHSVERRETNSNFGFNLPWWDWLFRTYRAQPAAGHDAMTIGLREFRDPRDCVRLDGLLLLPWRGATEDTEP
jgi:sterol desaturase/sphingolipid hydroxylase (fatty acid hydroxylase superfamily)